MRPKPELAARICELPYDVMSSDEAREMAAIAGERRGIGCGGRRERARQCEQQAERGKTKVTAHAGHSTGRETVSAMVNAAARRRCTAPMAGMPELQSSQDVAGDSELVDEFHAHAALAGDELRHAADRVRAP